MSFSKEQIIAELKRTATENGGKSLGRDRFSKDTGISENQIHKHWPTFSAAQFEAGLAPNTLQKAYEKDFLLESLVLLIREINKFPTVANLIMKSNHDKNFPSKDTFRRLGNKNIIVSQVLQYAKERGFSDVVSVCEAQVKEIPQESKSDDNVSVRVGEVYLFKHGKYFKIGRTNDAVRRGSELRIQLPENLTLIHSIKTDDTSGVEHYWHRRFADKRMNGEWFNLTTHDIQAFKLWKRIF